MQFKFANENHTIHLIHKCENYRQFNDLEQPWLNNSCYKKCMIEEKKEESA